MNEANHHPNGASAAYQGADFHTAAPRLIVRDRNGWIKLFELGAQGLSVGAAEGNAVRLEDTAISRFQLRLGLDQGRVTLTALSAEPVLLLEGEPIEPHRPRVWRPAQPLQLGAFVLELEQTVSVTPGTVGRSLPVGQALSAVGGGLIGVTLEQARERMQLRPGQREVVRVTLTNRGVARDEVHLGVKGLPAGWVKLPADPIQVDPHVPVSIPLTVTVPEPASARADDYHVTLTARAAGEAARGGEAHAVWTVQAVAGATRLAVNPETRTAARQARYTVRLSHTGNAPVVYSLRLGDDEGALEITPERVEVTVEPGQTHEQPFQVQALERPGFLRRKYQLSVRAHAAGREEQTTAAFIQPSTWLMPLLSSGLIFLALSLLVLRYFNVLHGAATPAPMLTPTPNQLVMAQATIIIEQQAQAVQQVTALANLEQTAAQQRVDAVIAQASAVSEAERNAAATAKANAEAELARLDALARTTMNSAQAVPAAAPVPLPDASLATATLTSEQTAATTPTANSSSSEASDSAPGYDSNPLPGSPIDLGKAVIRQTVSTTFTISETGNAALDVTSLTLSGVNAGDFSVASGGFSIPDGDPPKSITVTCTPSLEGVRTARLEVTHNAGGSPVGYDLTCTGAIAAPIYSSAPSSGAPITLGPVQSDQPATFSISVSEAGNAPLNVTSLTLSGANVDKFTVTPASFSISDGDPPTKIIITCTPKEGIYTATLTVTHNAVGSPASYNLICTGVPASQGRASVDTTMYDSSTLADAATATPTATQTETSTPSETATRSEAATPTASTPPAAVATATVTLTATPTSNSTPAAMVAPTSSPLPTETAMPTESPTPTIGPSSEAYPYP